MNTSKKMLNSRWQHDWDYASVGSRIAASLFWICIALFVMCVLPRAWMQVERAFREAAVSGQTDEDSTLFEGGVFRQKGSEVKGSLIRPGGSLSTDDLRRRLNELRSNDPGGPGHRSLNKGGQHGQ